MVVYVGVCPKQSTVSRRDGEVNIAIWHLELTALTHAGSRLSADLIAQPHDLPFSRPTTIL